jgi:hypothetical protein
MQELRRKDRAITEEEAIALLNKAEYGVLSTVTENGKPYGVPLNFCIIDHCIYFHCAIEGQKIENIKQNESVSFCAVGNTEILPDKFGTKYESVIPQMIVNKTMRNIKSSKRQGLALLLISFDKTGIEALSSAVFFIILFTLWESR